MNFTYILKKICQKYPGKVVVIENDRHITFHEYWRRVCIVSRLYQDLGIKTGERILIVLPNSVNFLIYYFAAMNMGAIAVPVKTDYKIHELSTIIYNCKPKLLISYDRWFNENPDIPLEVNPGVKPISVDNININWEDKEVELGIGTTGNSDAASINYSCFEDGYPKGAVLTHGNHIYAANGYVRHLGFNANDRFLIILPMPHVYTLAGCINSSLIKGSTMVLIDKFTPKAILSNIEKYKITILTAVPVVFEYLAKYKRKERYDISSLRRCVTGGDFMPENLQRNFEKMLKIQILQGYGLTESLPLICNPPGPRNKPGTLGIPGRKDIKVKIVNEDHVEKPVGQIGEVLVKSPTTMVGYYNLPGDTKKILEIDWLHTGDLGKIDTDGFLYFCGMKKKIFNVYGNKIDPLEVKNVLLKHPFIEKVEIYLETLTQESLIGNKRICADIYVIKGKELSKPEIIDYCKKNIADYKIPKKIELHTGG